MLLQIQEQSHKALQTPFPSGIVRMILKKMPLLFRGLRKANYSPNNGTKNLGIIVIRAPLLPCS